MKQVVDRFTIKQKNMKKITLSLLAIASVFSFLTPQKASAQNSQGQSVVTAGVGVSLVGILFNSVKDLVNSSPGATLTLKSTPVIIGAYDFGLADHFSIGAAFSYQQFSSSYTNYTYTNSQNVTVTGTFSDKVTRINAGIRPLVHFGGSDPNLDGYMGARISFTQWSLTTNNPDPYYSVDDSYSFTGLSPVKFQVVLGLRYFFTELIGGNMEVAFGPSYYFMGGINFRFGGSGDSPRK